MSENLDRLKSRVQAMLTNRFQVGLDSSGAWTIAYNSAQGWVRCSETEDGRLVVNIDAPLLFGVRPSPELYRHVALHANDLLFGFLNCTENEDGVMVLLSYRILGDYLDEEELLGGVIAVVASADQLDDELQGLFGGKRFID